MGKKMTRAELMAGSETHGEALKRKLKDPEFAAGYKRHLLAIQVAEALHDLREKKKLTQGQLAAKAGMKQHGISRIEKGEHAMTLDTVGRLAAAMGCSVKLQFVSR
jgi:DNA-binding XRE family transcriptional regulator